MARIARTCSGVCRVETFAASTFKTTWSQKLLDKISSLNLVRVALVIASKSMARESAMGERIRIKKYYSSH
jgi:uncharacterized protein YaeQ